MFVKTRYLELNMSSINSENNPLIDIAYLWKILVVTFEETGRFEGVGAFTIA